MRNPRVGSGTFLGALVVVAVVQVLQTGSIEGATGSMGRALLHSLTAGEACDVSEREASGTSSFVRAAWATYGSTLDRLAASGVPGAKQPGELSADLLRGRGDNALEALGGRVPPERALQFVALTIPLRASGPAQTVVLEPASMRMSLCW